MKFVFSAFPKALLWLFMLYWALLCGIVCLANPPKATLLALAGLPVLVCCCALRCIGLPAGAARQC